MHTYYPPAYVPTNHLEWLDSTDVTEIPYLTRFEPYYVARLPVPRFNESFINRGGNYAQQVRTYVCMYVSVSLSLCVCVCCVCV